MPHRGRAGTLVTTVAFHVHGEEHGEGPQFVVGGQWVLLAAMRVLLVDGASSTLATLAVVVVAMASCRSILALFTAANWAGSGALGADWPAVVRGRMTAVMGALGQL